MVLFIFVLQLYFLSSNNWLNNVLSVYFGSRNIYVSYLIVILSLSWSDNWFQISSQNLSLLNSYSFIDGLNSWLNIRVSGDSSSRNINISGALSLGVFNRKGLRLSVFNSSTLSDELGNCFVVLCQLCWLGDDQLLDWHFNFLFNDFWISSYSFCQYLGRGCFSNSNNSWFVGDIFCVPFLDFLQGVFLPVGLVNISICVVFFNLYCT